MPQKTSERVTIRVRLSDNEIEVSGPPDFVERKVSEFVNQMKAMHPAPPGEETLVTRENQSAPAKKKTSVAQFFKMMNPKTDVDRALAAGYYLERYRDSDGFTAADIRELIREAKKSPPKNPSDVINRNIRKGHMMAAGEKDGKLSFVLTSDGEEAVDDAISAA